MARPEEEEEEEREREEGLHTVAHSASGDCGGGNGVAGLKVINGGPSSSPFSFSVFLCFFFFVLLFLFSLSFPFFLSVSRPSFLLCSLRPFFLLSFPLFL